MEDPRFVVPYHDPYDTPLSPSIFSIASPMLADLTSIVGPSTLPQQQNHHGVQGGDHPPYFDPMIQDNFVHNNFPIGGVVGNFEAVPLQVHVDQGQPATNDILGSQNYNDVMTLTNWPQPPVPFSCSCCLVLREIVHTNGKLSNLLTKIFSFSLSFFLFMIVFPTFMFIDFYVHMDALQDLTLQNSRFMEGLA